MKRDNGKQIYNSYDNNTLTQKRKSSGKVDCGKSEKTNGTTYTV